MHDRAYWIEEIKQILEEKRSEWQKLEFKSGSELLSDRPDGANGTISPNEVKFDIAKDVSSMANASGGTIIYGIAEDDSKADSISPVTQKCIQAVAIEQILNSNIYPPILDIDIVEIALKEFSPLEFPGNDGKLIVIDIPRSTTAHMVERTFGKGEQRSGSRIAFCYYHRLATENRPMSGSMVEDVMGRTKKPKVRCRFHWEKIKLNEFPKETLYSLVVTVENLNNVPALHWKVVVEYRKIFPNEFTDSKLGKRGYRFSKEQNVTNETKEDGAYYSKMVCHSQHILFPQDSSDLINQSSMIQIHEDSLIKNPKAEIHYTVYADDMEPYDETILFSNINKLL